MRPPKQAGASSIDLVIIRLADWLFGDKNDIPTRFDLLHAEADCFAEAALDPIANDSAANTVAHRKTEAAVP
jgi:hypothetical protein